MTARRTLFFWLALLVPVALIVVFTVPGERSKAALTGDWLPYVVYALILTSGAALTLFANRKLAALYDLSPPTLGGWASLGVGTTVGLVSTGTCAVLHYAVDRPTFASPLWPALRPGGLIANIGVGALEEVGFRAGVVHVLAQRWGPLAGLLGGSVPFGVLHLAGIAFGRVPSFRHVISVSVAGWLYSLLYLKWGVAAPMASHWLWNSLASNWGKATMQKSLDAFESAWTTIGPYLLLCVALHLVGPRLNRRES